LIPPSALIPSNHDLEQLGEHHSLTQINFLDRRRALRQAIGAFSIVSTTLLPALHASNAEEITSVDASTIFLRLKSIPTFCLVDPKGVPFMIFDGEASATGYFFLSYDIAARALADAKEKDKNAGADAIWDEARIIVVPLAVALQVTLRKSQRVAVNNGIRFKTYGDIVPSQEGINDAKSLDPSTTGTSLSTKWEQKGRVPLFYIAGMKLQDGREPRYFNKRDLMNEWSRQNPSAPAPKINLVEMVGLFRSALSGSKNGGDNNLGAIENLAIIPVKESNQVASQLLQRQSNDNPLPKYDFNQVFLVGSAQG
jgi:hypothetical protein